MAILLWTDPDTFIQHGIEFDATVTEELTFSSNVTRSPIEKGVATTDHVEPEPDGVRLEGMVTNTPLVDRTPGAGFTDGDLYGPIVSAFLPETVQYSTKYLQTGARVRPNNRTAAHLPGVPPRLLSGGTATVTPAVWSRRENVQTFQVLKAVTPVDRVQKVLEFLRSLAFRGVEFSLDTRYVFFPSMLISSVVCPTTNQDSMTFALDIISAQFSEVTTTTIAPKRTAVAQTRQQQKVSAGVVPVDPFHPGGKEDKAQTILDNNLGWAAEFFR